MQILRFHFISFHFIQFYYAIKKRCSLGKYTSEYNVLRIRFYMLNWRIAHSRLSKNKIFFFFSRFFTSILKTHAHLEKCAAFFFLCVDTPRNYWFEPNWRRWNVYTVQRTFYQNSQDANFFSIFSSFLITFSFYHWLNQLNFHRS